MLWPPVAPGANGCCVQAGALALLGALLGGQGAELWLGTTGDSFCFWCHWVIAVASRGQCLCAASVCLPLSTGAACFSGKELGVSQGAGRNCRVRGKEWRGQKAFIPPRLSQAVGIKPLTVLWSGVDAADDCGYRLLHAVNARTECEDALTVPRR